MKASLFQYLSSSLFILLSSSLHAELALKEESLPGLNWLSYGLGLTVLIIVAIIIQHKYRPILEKKSAFTLVEKKYLSNKTVIYLLQYQGKYFMLADNQQALSLQPLEDHD